MTAAPRAIEGGTDGPDAAFQRRAFATLFLILAAHGMSETARDALFLARLPVAQLPWMYLIVAAGSLAAARAVTLLTKARSTSPLPLLLASAAAVSAMLWASARPDSPAFLYVLYLWPAVFSSVVVSEFWRVLSDAYTIAEAKAAFGRIGTAGTVGALAGSGLAVVLTSDGYTGGLLGAATAALALSTITCPRLAPARAAESSREDHLQTSSSLVLVGRHPYLFGVLVCLFVSTVTGTLVDYLFKSAVSAGVPVSDLPRTLALVSVGISAGTLLLQSAAVGPLLQGLGVTGGLTVLPAIVSLAAAAVLAGGGLSGTVLLRLADAALRYSVHRTAADLLYVPLTPSLRARCKSVIDVLSQRGGQVAGSLAVLAALTWGADTHIVAGFILILSVIGCVVALRLRRPFLDVFRQALHRDDLETRLTHPTLDLDSLGALVATFSSPRHEEVVAALDLTARQGQVRAIPVVMLFHPHRSVVLRTLELFATHGRPQFLWALDVLRERATDPLVRAAAMRAHVRQGGDETVLQAGVGDACEEVRMTALTMQAARTTDAPAAMRRLTLAVAGASRAGTHAALEAMRVQPSSIFDEALLHLARLDDRDTRREAAVVMALQPSPRYLEPLTTMLPDSATREFAQLALLAIGPAALHHCGLAFDDPDVPRSVRIHVPRAISRFPAPESMPVLWRQLQRERDDVVRFRILRGLNRLARQSPDVRPTADALTEAVRLELNTALGAAHWRGCLLDDMEPPTATSRLLVRFLEDRQARKVEAIFRLLGLRHPTEDFEQMFRGLHGDRRLRASGRELLEHVLPGPEWRRVVALLNPNEPLPARLVPAPLRAVVSSADALVSIIATSAPPLRQIAERRARERGPTSLAGGVQ